MGSQEFNIANMLQCVLSLFSLSVNCQLAWRIWRRKHLHSVFNLGYCYYFTLSGIISCFIFNEYGSLLTNLINSGKTSLGNCHRLGLLNVAADLVYKVFLANLIFRYVIIKYSHYGMGVMGSIVDTNGWIIKVLYFTLMLSYGLMAYLGYVLTFSTEETIKKSVKGKICLLKK